MKFEGLFVNNVILRRFKNYVIPAVFERESRQKFNLVSGSPIKTFGDDIQCSAGLNLRYLSLSVLSLQGLG